MDVGVRRNGWLQLNSPCLWEHVSIVMEVCFLVFIIIHLGLKWMGVVRNSRASSGDEELKKTVIKLSFSYRISLVSCLVMVGTHSFIFLVLFRGTTSHCDLLQAFSAEILQVLSWGIASFAVMKTYSKKLLWFPWILRSWWLCTFFLSALSLAFKTHFRAAKHIRLGFQEFADLTTLLASLILLATSVRGKTDLCILDSSEITEPLLKDDQRKKDSPYGKASIFQRMTFSWLNPLFSVGYKRPLEKEDILL